MATKRRKSRRSCKHGKLKRPVRTRRGGKRRCKKSKSRKRKSKSRKRRKYKMMNVNDKIELVTIIYDDKIYGIKSQTGLFDLKTLRLYYGENISESFISDILKYRNMSDNEVEFDLNKDDLPPGFYDIHLALFRKEGDKYVEIVDDEDRANMILEESRHRTFMIIHPTHNLVALT